MHEVWVIRAKPVMVRRTCWLDSGVSIVQRHWIGWNTEPGYPGDVNVCGLSVAVRVPPHNAKII